jgi:uncharacterized protein (DUF433 family)
MKNMTGIIDSNPKILGGKPIIKGTRIPVDLIFELFGLNYSLDYIIDQYPSLTKEILLKVIEIAQDAQKNLQTANWEKILS